MEVVNRHFNEARRLPIQPRALVVRGFFVACGRIAPEQAAPGASIRLPMGRVWEPATPISDFIPAP